MGLNVIDPNIRKSMQKFGIGANYFQSRLCSCVAKNNGSFDSSCDCIQGFYYYSPVTVRLIRTSMKYPTIITPSGRSVNIDALFTIPKLYKGIEQNIWTSIAHGDIISLVGKSRRDTDILTRGVRDYIHAFDVDKILSVYSTTVQYVEGIDFTTSIKALDFEDDANILFEDGNAMIPDETRLVPGETMTINWNVGKGPQINETYTVEFICREQYRIWDDGAMNRGTSVDDLPKKVKAVIRRFVNPEKNVIDTINLQQGIF